MTNRIRSRIFYISILIFLPCSFIFGQTDIDELKKEKASKLEFIKELITFKFVESIFEDSRCTDMHQMKNIIELDKWKFYYDFQQNDQNYIKNLESVPKTSLLIRDISVWWTPAAKILAVFITDGSKYISMYTDLDLDIEQSHIFTQKLSFQTKFGTIYKYSNIETYKDDNVQKWIDLKAIGYLKYQP